MNRKLHKALKSKGYLLAALTFPTGKPDVEIHRFQMIDVHRQKKRFSMKADSAEVYQKQNLSTVRMPETLIWNHQSEPYKIMANEGIIQTLSQDLSLRKNCSLLSPDGTLFQTESLDYENSSGILTSEDSIRALRAARQSGDEMEISGRGLKIETKKDFYQILSDVSAQKKNHKQNDLKILSERVNIQPAQNFATFLGEVKVYSDKMQLLGDSLKTIFKDKKKAAKKNSEGGEIERLELESNPEKAGRKIVAKLEKIDLYSDGMTVYFNESGELDKMEAHGKVDAVTRDKIKMRSEKLIYASNPKNPEADRLYLQGDVTIETSDRTAQCQEAEFDPQSGQIILKHVATVKKESQVLKGERIRFSTKDSEVFVDEASGELHKQSLGF
jgi:LPS export ABC transporter protein LptC